MVWQHTKDTISVVEQMKRGVRSHRLPLWEDWGKGGLHDAAEIVFDGYCGDASGGVPADPAFRLNAARFVVLSNGELSPQNRASHPSAEDIVCAASPIGRG